MNIKYFFRNNKAGFSITEVFNTIVEEIGKSNKIEKIYLPSPYADLFHIIKNGIFAKKHYSKNYINHITGDVHYLLWFFKKDKTIVTVHDIMYYYYLNGIKKFIWKLLYIYPLKYAEHITFISDFAYRQVAEQIKLKPEKIHIIPNPVDKSFIYSPTDFNELKPIVLHIGTKSRKNLANTIEALKDIKCHLRIIGKIDNNTNRILNEYNIEFSNSFNLSHEEIVNEYKKADIVNFPSLFEGFGMPIIEGQATGRIVVTSNISPMKEVAGEGAVLVNPQSVESINRAYKKIIYNQSYRDEIIRKGLLNVEKYKVENISKQYINLYKTMLK